MKVHLAIPYELLRERLEEVLRHRLCPEIYFDAQALEGCNDADLRACAEALRGEGLTFSFHGPFMDLAPGALDSKIKEVTWDRFSETMRLASLVRPECVVFHVGYDPWRHGEYKELWIASSLEIWRPLFAKAEETGIRVALENVFDEGPHLIGEILRRAGNGWVGFCFDPAHHLLFSKVPLGDWLAALGERLVEVHVHDNHGQMDEHLPPGDGRVDFELLFSLLPHRDLLFTLEVHREEYVKRGLEGLMEMLQSWEATG